MKPEDKAALKAGGTTFLVGSLVAVAFANPMSWIAVAYGTYKIGKAARRSARARATIDSSDEKNLFI
jgi:hypothetical protein